MASDLYFDVFVESFLSATIIPHIHNLVLLFSGIFGIALPSIVPMNNTTFFAMLSFGNHDMKIAAIFAIIGAVIGAFLSFFIGRWIAGIYHQEGGERHLSREKYFKASRFFSRYMIVLLPLSWIPLLNVLPIISGFFDTKTKTVLPLIIIGYILHYGYFAF